MTIHNLTRLSEKRFFKDSTLNSCFDFPTKGEPFQSLCLADICKDRFHCSHALCVFLSLLLGIHLLLHCFRNRQLLSRNRNRQSSALGVLEQALDAKITCLTNLLVPNIKAASLAVNHSLPCIKGKDFPGRTTVEILFFVIRKSGQRKLSVTLWLILFLIRQSRVSFSKIVVRDNGIQFFFFTRLEVLDAELSTVADEGSLFSLPIRGFASARNFSIRSACLLKRSIWRLRKFFGESGSSLWSVETSLSSF